MIDKNTSFYNQQLRLSTNMGEANSTWISENLDIWANNWHMLHPPPGPCQSVGTIGLSIIFCLAKEG